MTKGLVYTTWPRGKIVLQILSIPVFFFLVTCAHSGLFYLACSPHLTRSIRKDVSREVCKCVCCFSGGMAAQGELQTHSVRGTSVSLFICGFVWVWETEGKGEREEERETCLSLQEINSIHWKKNLSVLLSDKKEIEPLFLFKPPTWSTGERYTFCAQKLYKGSDMDLPTPTF